MLTFDTPVLRNHVNRTDCQTTAPIPCAFCNVYFQGVRIGRLEKYLFDDEYEEESPYTDVVYRFTSESGNTVLSGNRDAVLDEVLSRLTAG